MDLFHIIEGAQAIVFAKPGIYRQVPLYERAGKLFAKHGAGFIKIMTHGGTSHPNVRCDPANIDMGDSGFALVANKHEWQVSGPKKRAA